MTTSCARRVAFHPSSRCLEQVLTRALQKVLHKHWGNWVYLTL